MRSLKSVGLREVRSLRQRTRRLLAMERIYPEDADYIGKRCEEIEARIVSMSEVNEYGKEED